MTHIFFEVGHYFCKGVAQWNGSAAAGRGGGRDAFSIMHHFWRAEAVSGGGAAVRMEPMLGCTSPGIPGWYISFVFFFEANRAAMCNGKTGLPRS
jgi:hypothetical protein